jgi:hypothetical protein
MEGVRGSSPLSSTIEPTRVGPGKTYRGPARLSAAAKEQITLLQEQGEHLATEAEQIALRRRYVDIKIGYWHAVDAGDDGRAEILASEAP